MSHWGLWGSHASLAQLHFTPRMSNPASRAWNTVVIFLFAAACSATPRETPGPNDSDAAAITDGSHAAIGDGHVECFVTAPTSCPEPPVRYVDVAPVFQQHCVTSCHSGIADGPWPLTDYEHAADWWDIIRATMLNCSMPPIDAGSTITLEERLAILTWLRCGFPP